MMKLSRLLAVVCFFLPIAFIVTDARAAFLGFREEGDVVIVETDDYFECGITVTVSGEAAHVDACWLTNSPPGYTGTAVAYMVEPAGPNEGAISDEIHVDFFVDGYSLAHMTVDFVSDTDGDPLRYVPPGFPFIVEDGTYQLLNLAFANPATGQPVLLPDNIEMRAMSDLEPVPNTPMTWSGIKTIYRN